MCSVFPMKIKPRIPKSKDKKSKELMEFLKKGGREGAKEDFQKLIQEGIKQEPFDKKE